MNVERAFTTTLDPADALRLASHLLGSRGFTPTATSAVALEMTRTPSAGREARPLLQNPQQIRLRWAHAEVTATAEADAFQGKSAALQHRLLTDLLAHVQQLLEAQLDLDQVAHAWSAAEDELHRQELARRRRNKWVAAAAAGVLVVGAAAGAVITAMHLH
jgi:hypothetical protein